MKTLLTALLLTGALVLSGCGGENDHEDHSATEAAAEATYNAADLLFTQGMIPHHEQAVAMSELAPDRAESPEVLTLAQNVQAAQQPEIDQLNGWLAQWDESPMDDAHADHDMQGMLSEAEFAELESLTGAAFDARWLELMITHHEGAIQMSEIVIANGQNDEVTALAEVIIDAQQAEIDHMQELLS